MRLLQFQESTFSLEMIKHAVVALLSSTVLVSCAQSDNRADCAHLLTIRKAPQSDQKIQTSELRVKLSERLGLLPAQVDLFCIHYLGKTPFVRRKSAKESNKPLET